MDLTSEQINALVELQQTDLDIAKQRKALEALPQKQLIAELRRKRIAIKDKQIDMQTMKEDAQTAVSELAHEDERLSAKQAEAQSAIEAARGDYRSVTSHTKEIEGAVRRRDAIAEELLGHEARIEQIDALLSQTSQALAALDGKEQQAMASYKAEGGKLAASIKELEAKRAQCAGRLPADLFSTYERIAKGKCGVAVSFLINGACNACRSQIDPARAIQMKRVGRLSTCPHCGRLIVVD